MLQFIRGTVGTWVVKILFVLLIASFAIWGIGDIFRGRGPSTAIAEIGPTKIPASELDSEFRKQVDRLRPMFGGQLDMEQAKQLGLVDQTLDAIVERSLLDLAAQDMGLNTGDELVRRRLQQLPGFRNAHGEFDPELLRRALASNSMGEAALIDMIRAETGRQLVVGAVDAGAVVPEPMVDALYRFRNEKRVAETLTLANDHMPEPSAPDEAELTRVHEDKAIRFTAPEFRTLTVGLATVDDYAKTVEVTEDEIKAAYDTRADEFQVPERRSFDQVLTDTEDKAKAVAEKARAANGDLAAAAKAEGLDVTTVGLLAEADVPVIGASVFDLQADAIPDPFHSDLGWHVIKVTKIDPPHIHQLAEVRDDVIAQLKKSRAVDDMPRLANMLEDALAGGSTLAETAARYRIKLIRIEAVDSTGLKPDGSKVADAPDMAAGLAGNLATVLQTAFNLTQGNHSQVTSGADDSSFVVQVDAITPSRLKPLAEVRDQVVTAWKVDQRAAAADKLAGDILTQLKGGATIEAVAAATGAVAATTEPLPRSPGQDKGKLPAELTKQLFSLPLGGVAKATTADGQIVVRLKQIVPADPAAAAGLVAGLRDAEQRTVGSDLVAEFTVGLRDRFPVKINRERIDQMFSSN
jgi:peptidyl-prolyl cis-trans isomerase D